MLKGSSTAMASSEKRYRTRRQWNNTRFTATALPFLVVPATVIALVYSVIWLIGASAIVALLLLGLAFARDRRRTGEYRVNAEGIILARGSHRKRIAAGDVLDSSLMERSTCREYVKRRLAQRGVAGLQDRLEAEKSFTRFCSVDIGLNSWTFGLGRRVIDRMSNVQNDLLLLRTKSGDEFLLSPDRNQEMMEQISRLKRRQSEGPALNQL